MNNVKKALEVRLDGVVQGVGFRPFVHRVALRLGLTGWVRNEQGSVRIQAEGPPPALLQFPSALREEAPPLARIWSVLTRDTAVEGFTGFRVLPSTRGHRGRLPVSPDVAVCPACLAEFRDPTNRRHRYPFITCTDCGPRFTVIQEMPYDRERTAMSPFEQCPECQAEYVDPGNRRYHSETNSCFRCGPRLWFERPGNRGKEGKVPGSDEALTEAANLLLTGGVLALQGLGGFHLAADATDEAAVGTLRTRKGRGWKPFAVMVADVGGAERLAILGEMERRLLSSPEAPIVLAPTRADSPLAAGVAPGLNRVGVMVPYSPLHHLLLALAGRPLLMTSGNRSKEPLAFENEEALLRLAPLADGFLLHDRKIVNSCDDSVVRVASGRPVMIRRARGHAPLPLPLPNRVRKAVLAVGSHLKATFTLATEDTAFVSPHLGDMDTEETVERFLETLDRFRELFRIDPEVLARDLHPGYFSTRLAGELAETWGTGEPIPVQHHHAHVAAVMAEHGVEGPVVGLAYDGTGYGDDGTVWGGEVLLADLQSYRRVGHLRPAPLPGAEAAVRNPWRTVLGYFSLDPTMEEVVGPALKDIPEAHRGIVLRQCEAGVNAPLASSMGRLFDAAAAILGLRNRCHYEGQAAMELEAAAEGASVGGPGSPDGIQPHSLPSLPFPVERVGQGPLTMDPLPLLSALGAARRSGASVGDLALAFHHAVADTAAEIAANACAESGLDTVVLSGGVFQNAILMGETRERLERRELKVLAPQALSPNDGAISYGQAAVAAALLGAGGARSPNRDRGG